MRLIKTSLVIALLYIPFLINGERKISKSDSILIKGMVKKEAVITLADLDTMPKVDLKDIEIFNHKGEPKGKHSGLKGVSLLLILKHVSYKYEKPNELNVFYFNCIATDGYKVVFSWNEIYNTTVGSQIFILTEQDGKTLKDMDDRLILVSMADITIGRRYVKGLSGIEVNRLP
jgi:hypothetical protein